MSRDDARTADELLVAVHARTGGQGVDIQTFGSATSNQVEIRWRRAYDGGALSDERCVADDTLVYALRAVLATEDAADELDAEDDNK